MGMRFRKSKKIGPVRITLSQSGISSSIGGKVGRITANSNGRTTLTTRIPGSGISYVETVGSKSRASTKQSRKNTIDKLSVSSYVYSHNRDVERLININSKSEVVQSPADVQQRLVSLQPDVYVKQTFKKLPPDKEEIRRRIQVEAQVSVSKVAFWSLQKRRNEYVDEKLNKRYGELYHRWETEKSDFEDRENAIAGEKNKAYREEYEQKWRYLQNILSGNPAFIEQEIDAWLNKVDTPLDFTVQYDYDDAHKSLYVDLDLPEIEDLPDEVATQLASGKLKMKKKTQTDLRQDYAQCVFGFAVYLASHFYNISTVIEKILITGYTQRRDKDGNLNDDYIYSIIFNRSEFEHQNLPCKNPVEFCMSFVNRCNLSKTNIFKTIKPFDPARPEEFNVPVK